MMPTTPPSQHTQASLLQLSRDFTKSRIFITAAELDVFTLLSGQALTAARAADACQATLRGMGILLDALTAQGFLDKQDGKYQTRPAIQRLLSANSPDNILPMVQHAAGLWKRWSQLTDIIQGKAAPDQENDEGSTLLQNLVKAMHVVNAAKAPAVIHQIQPGHARRLLDVGGGAGSYTAAFLRAVPEMQATLFDFPTVIAVAEAQLRADRLQGRVNLVSGNYLKDALPPGHDLALLSAITHQHPPEENSILYRNVYQALLPGGRIVIRGFVMEDDKACPTDGALFAVNMLANTLGGQTYSFAETRNGLLKAGFTDVRLLLKADGLFSLIDAFK